MSSSADLGKLLLRLSLGILILLHGIAKLSSGVGGIENMMAAHSLPAFFAWGVYIGEVLAPLLLILGLYTRLSALVIAINMIVAVALVHMSHLFQLTGSGGWRLELQAMFLFTALAIALLGAGRYSLGGNSGRWN